MNSLTVSKRQEKLFEYLLDNNFATISELSEKTNFSQSTVRRDIKELEKMGKVSVFHGGVSIRQTYDSFSERSTRAYEEKKRIAVRAVRYVEDGDVIYIAGGSTTTEFAKQLAARDDLSKVTIVACALNVAVECLANKSYRVFIGCGEIISYDESMTSKETTDYIKKYDFSKVFLGCQAFNIKHGLMYPRLNINELNKTIVNNANQVILLSDSSKVGGEGEFSACSFDDVNLFVTDDNPENIDKCKEMMQHGLDVVFA